MILTQFIMVKNLGRKKCFGLTKFLSLKKLTQNQVKSKCQHWKKQRKWKLFNYMSRPQNSFWTLPQQQKLFTTKVHQIKRRQMWYITIMQTKGKNCISAKYKSCQFQKCIKSRCIKSLSKLHCIFVIFYIHSIRKIKRLVILPSTVAAQVLIWPNLT